MRKWWEKYANHFAFDSQNGIAESHVALLCSPRDKRDKNNYKASNVPVRCYLRASLFAREMNLTAFRKEEGVICILQRDVTSANFNLLKVHCLLFSAEFKIMKEDLAHLIF